MRKFWRWLLSIDYYGKRWFVDLRPDFGWKHWLPVVAYGGDEYGNLSVYLKTKLFQVVFFYGRDVQRDVELPEPGECEWIDRVYFELAEEEED